MSALRDPGARHPCPCEGCAVSLPRHLLMCKPHWYRVPQALRAEVNDAWRAHSRQSTRETLVRYLAAREAAIRSINGAEAHAPC